MSFTTASALRPSEDSSVTVSPALMPLFSANLSDTMIPSSPRKRGVFLSVALRSKIFSASAGSSMIVFAAASRSFSKYSLVV
ncbi:MAG: hypothetical protein J6S47_03170 [Eubacteriaceae bacterium]|nr:hypothetical protein [Eubacteriaceae bacterium]